MIMRCPAGINDVTSTVVMTSQRSNTQPHYHNRRQETVECRVSPHSQHWLSMTLHH